MIRRDLSLLVLAVLSYGSLLNATEVQINRGDHICYIGNTMADRMQHHGWLETYIHSLHPTHDLTFRNLALAGDEVKTRPRAENFGSPDQWLTKCNADVVFGFFGYNESLRGAAGLAAFVAELNEMIDGMLSNRYNGKSAPRIVLFSPIAHENLNSPHLPDGSANNQNIALYTDAMKKACLAKGIQFVDLFTPSQQLYAEVEKPLTMNGIHLLDHGNQVIAKVIVRELFPQASLPQDADVATLRDAVLDKNYYWFSRYRVVDEYNVFGGRSKLAWDGISNADVMGREMEIFDTMTENRDKRVWAVAKGGELVVDDKNIPETLAVPTNKPGPMEGGKWPYLGGETAISQMQVHAGMQVNLFASEEQFPRLVNPVQMAVDTDSRLWVSVWPSYPHWNPVEPREDALLIFPDDDRDGKADDCIVFADELNSITGFEFWNDGVLVAAPPEIWYLKDTDGDNKADYKLRMLQGVSSADTHHSANAMLVGPDGWLYWSRGIFNVANFETPTKTYRSGASGVHRFNPRTFEVEFHFPIGPNPHGDVFDQWGFQFANDGTSGTGSYVNIGKGVDHKKWFEKRVRPVAATGILSSSHFPEKLQGNFLINNCIGFLGTLQHEVHYDGADITAREIDPIVVSSDPNFRPSDLEIGGDGALYISDWHNTLIGHMQHNMRDPNRDHEHGRIYRVTQTGSEPLEPAKMRGKPITEVCEHFFSKTNGVRYRARLELTSRNADEIVAQVGAFAASLDPKSVTSDRDEAQALLECLWVFEEQRIPNMELLAKVFQGDEPRVRAAAIRTLGHWAGRVADWEMLLLAAARDESALVRAEAVKAAVDFRGFAAEVVFEAATRPTDPELDIVLNYAKSQINVDALVQDALKSGRKLSDAAQAYVLLNANVSDLMKLEKTEAVYRAMLSRTQANQAQLAEALSGLARMTDASELDLLMDLIENAQKDKDSNLAELGQLLTKQSPSSLQRVKDRIERLAVEGTTSNIKRVAYAAWVAASGPDDAFLAASKSKERLKDFLDAVPTVDPAVRGQLYDKVEPLISSLPSHLQAEGRGSQLHAAGIHVDYFYPSGSDVAIETLEKMKPVASGIVPEIVMDVPQLKQRDRFALRFTGMISAPQPGKYTFYIASDDGSRIYLNDKLLVNNDGLHGMSEKNASIELPAGSHKFVVTYFDNGGGDGLNVSWDGPGFTKQKIDAKYLSVGGSETLHDIAIRALASIPGSDEAKFKALASVVAAGQNRPAAISALRNVPAEGWPLDQINPLVDNLIGYLTSMPARYRTGTAAADAIALTKSLATKLPEQRAKSIEERLQNLDVRVIAIGTVAHRMIFDKELITVQAGKPVEFRFSNTDAMPHNFAITMPGFLAEVGELAEATGRDPDAMARHYIPKTDKILLSSKLLQPGENESLSFEAPTQPGVYPYVCTYPGHWRRMHGALYVVDNLEEYQANPEAYLAAANLPIKDELLKLNRRSHEWTFDELASDIKTLPMGRSFEVGKQLFKVASCVGCHKLDNEGRIFGPDLAKLDPKKQTTEYILQSIVDPSKVIDEKFQSYTFLLASGKVVTGMIVEDNAEAVHVVIDPLAKDKPTIIKKDDIDDQKKSELSLMPKGLLNKLTREEIFDLLAFVYAKGDREHKMFGHEHHHH